jgi:hypothetical protein
LRDNNNQWPQELDAYLEVPSESSSKMGSQSGKVTRDEKTGVWSHKENNVDEFLDPLESTFSSMILEESMLQSEINGESSSKKEKTDISGRPELNNMYRLHGNVPQKVRQEVYKKFCKAKNGILVRIDEFNLYRFT